MELQQNFFQGLTNIKKSALEKSNIQKQELENQEVYFQENKPNARTKIQDILAQQEQSSIVNDTQTPCNLLEEFLNPDQDRKSNYEQLSNQNNLETQSEQKGEESTAFYEIQYSYVDNLSMLEKNQLEQVHFNISLQQIKQLENKKGILDEYFEQMEYLDEK